MKKIVAQCNANINYPVDLTYLKEFLPDYDVMYGPEALELVKRGKVAPENVIVIQEDNSKIARKLRKKGAIAKINYCFESQIYAGYFYSQLKKIAPNFQYRIYYKGMLKKLKSGSEKNNIIAYYPYVARCEVPEKSWDTRSLASMVMSNKYVEQKNVFPDFSFDFRKYLKWFFRLFYESPTRKFLRENELQNKRLEVIEYFGSKNELKLSGRDWDHLYYVPKCWQKRLKQIICKLNPQTVENKLEFISNFKFNFAIENLRDEGYVTEKIIQPMIAGTIPVYLGAPDIYDYVPQGCFIDMRDFESLDDLYFYMKNMTAEEAQKYLDAAKNFLESEDSNKYSEEYFSKFIAELIRS